MSYIVVGSRTGAYVQFRVGGVLRDADVVTATLRSPLGEVTTETFPGPNLTRLGVGEYRLEFTPTIPGQWAVRMAATGQIEAVGEAVIAVAPSFVL